MMLTPALTPSLSAPASIMMRAEFRVCIPPEALIPSAFPTAFFISATYSGVVPPVPKPVEVFTKSAPASCDNRHAKTFSSSVRRHVSIITFTLAPPA